MITEIFGYIIDLNEVLVITPVEHEYYQEVNHFAFSIYFKNNKNKLNFNTNNDPSFERDRVVKEWMSANEFSIAS